MIRNLAAGIAVAALTLIISGCSTAARTGTQEEKVPLVGDLKVHRYTLSNGLRLLVVEDKSSPTLSYETWFRVGSREEIPGKTGLAHLFEHLMFKGTKNHKEGEFDRMLEGAGAEGENAFTTRNYTAYVQELPKDRLELIVQLESDRMVNLIVDENSFKTEREVVQNERRYRTENDPDGSMYQDIFGLAFEKHPYHWPVIGYQADLTAMEASDAFKFYKDYYSPDHATIIVSGDVNAFDVLDLVRKHYGNIPASAPPPHEIPAEPPQTSARHKVLPLNIQVEKLLMGYHVPAVTDADTPALQVLMAVLAGGKSSRLYRALVDTGITTMVDTYSMDDRDPSLAIVMANLQKGHRAAEAETVVQRELARLTREEVSEKELDRAKNGIRFDFYQGLSSNSSRSRFLGVYESLTGSFENGLALQQKMQAVTPAEIMAVTKKYMIPSNRSVVIGVPKGAKSS